MSVRSSVSDSDDLSHATRKHATLVNNKHSRQPENMNKIGGTVQGLNNVHMTAMLGGTCGHLLGDNGTILYMPHSKKKLFTVK